MFVGFQNVSMSSIILYTNTHKQAHIQTDTTKSHQNTYSTLCVQLKPNGDYGSLLVFTRATSCIFPSVALKTVVLSGEVLLWFFHWVIILLFAMHCAAEKKKWRAIERAIVKWWELDMRTQILEIYQVQVMSEERRVNFYNRRGNFGSFSYS